MIDKKASPQRSRGWLTVNLRMLFLAVTIVAIAFAYRHIRRQVQFQRFKAFVGQDIRTLPEADQHRLSSIVKDLVFAPESFEFDADRPQNWYVWQLSSGATSRFVLLQGQPLVKTPGTSSANIYLFDSVGQMVGRSSFSTGWRADVVDAALLPNKIGSEPVIRINTIPDINGRDLAAQYYGIRDDSVVLLRLEDGSGNCIPNIYSWPNLTIGPLPSARKDSEWTRALHDSGTIEVLQALIWLGGDHTHRDTTENAGEVTGCMNVRRDPETRAALERLAGDKDRWISQSAKLALEKIANGP